jgi:hypothetical protein
MLVEEFELGILWDEYGLVGDIIVCILFILFCRYIRSYRPHSPSLIIFQGRTSTNYSHLTFYTSLLKAHSRTMSLLG